MTAPSQLSCRVKNRLMWACSHGGEGNKGRASAGVCTASGSAVGVSTGPLTLNTPPFPPPAAVIIPDPCPSFDIEVDRHKSKKKKAIGKPKITKRPSPRVSPSPSPVRPPTGGLRFGAVSLFMGTGGSCEHKAAPRRNTHARKGGNRGKQWRMKQSQGSGRRKKKNLGSNFSPPVV